MKGDAENACAESKDPSSFINLRMKYKGLLTLVRSPLVLIRFAMLLGEEQSH